MFLYDKMIWQSNWSIMHYSLWVFSSSKGDTGHAGTDGDRGDPGKQVTFYKGFFLCLLRMHSSVGTVHFRSMGAHCSLGQWNWLTDVFWRKFDLPGSQAKWAKHAAKTLFVLFDASLIRISAGQFRCPKLYIGFDTYRVLQNGSWVECSTNSLCSPLPSNVCQGTANMLRNKGQFAPRAM